MDILEQIAWRIIKEQELIIGPLALEEAGRVAGVKLDQTNQSVLLSGNKTEIVDHLVAQYERLFGQASVQVCRDAALPLLPGLEVSQLPQSLK